MRIGLVDVDGHNFANLALMKLTTYHKQRGDEVEWAFPLLPYDRVYMAKVFTFTQDLDIRLMTAEKADMIQQCKKKMLHFAWDNPEDELTFEKLKEYRKAFSLPDDKCKVYVLTNFNSTYEQDLERVYRLRDIGYDPFVMVYEKWNAPKETRRLQRGCNNKVIFRAEPDFAKYK